jgi:hypothetical protein
MTYIKKHFGILALSFVLFIVFFVFLFTHYPLTASSDVIITTTGQLISTVPGVPTSVSAIAGDTSALITFNLSDPHGATITNYTVTSNPANLTSSGLISPIEITGLTNGASYTFTVTATNSNGTSASSSPSNAVTPGSTLSYPCPNGGGLGLVNEADKPKPVQPIVPQSPPTTINTILVINVPPVTTEETHCNIGNITLRRGSLGDSVKELQKFLNEKLNIALIIDGIFGPKTFIAVKQWQSAHGLVADGIVGVQTRKMISGI